jgi:CNT family concentrative nucleoside transporter
MYLSAINNMFESQEKSILISHYAICGFSNFGSIAIQMATLNSLAPLKSKLFAKIALKSMIAGNIGNFLEQNEFKQKKLGKLNQYI